MRVLCGGEDGVMGIYGGELLLEDKHRDAANRLVRIDAIYKYPGQRAIITGTIMERLPLPFGAVVRIRVIGPCTDARAANRAGYEVQVRAAHRRLTETLRAQGDAEACTVLERRDAAATGISGSYCRR